MFIFLINCLLVSKLNIILLNTDFYSDLYNNLFFKTDSQICKNPKFNASESVNIVQK